MGVAIYLDIDGVMADFHGSVCRTWGLDPKVSEEMSGWDLPSMLAPISKRIGYELTEDDFWSAIRAQGEAWWADLPILPWARELHALCEEFGVVTFMTAPAQYRDAETGRWKCLTSCLPGKVQWIERHFPDATRWAITPVKHHMSHRGSVLIDDSPKGCAKFKEFYGSTAYLFPRPWGAQDWKERQPLEEVSTLLQDFSNRVAAFDES